MWGLMLQNKRTNKKKKKKQNKSLNWLPCKAFQRF